MMISKVATVFFCFALARNSCRAAATGMIFFGPDDLRIASLANKWFFDKGLGVFVHKKNEVTMQPLDFMMDAVREGNFAHLALVLSTNSVDVNDSVVFPGDKVPTTPLSVAICASTIKIEAAGQYVDCVKLLLQYGANPNVVYDGAPLICHAVKRGNLMILRALLACGADIRLLDYKQLSVFSYLYDIQSLYCLEKKEALTVEEIIKETLFRHCADVLFKAIDNDDEQGFASLYKLLRSRLFGECGGRSVDVMLLQNYQDRNVIEYGLDKGFLQEAHSGFAVANHYKSKTGLVNMMF